MQGRPLTPEQIANFLDHLARTANVTRSAELANVDRPALYKRRKADLEFAKAWDEAVDLGTDALEDEAIRRAHEGVDDPVFFQGNKCGTIRRYSDTLLIFMLKARRPDVFKDRTSTELTGKDGGPIEIETARASLADRIARLATARPEAETPGKGDAG
jgi:hypothetical protein